MNTLNNMADPKPFSGPKTTAYKTPFNFLFLRLQYDELRAACTQAVLGFEVPERREPETLSTPSPQESRNTLNPKPDNL